MNARRWKRYPKYRDSGVEWLGEVPGHWQVKRLRFAVEFNPPRSQANHLPVSTEVSFVPMEAVGEWGGIDLSTSKSIDAIGSGYTWFQDGDVVVAKITPCFENGKGALAQGLTNGAAFGTTELHVLRPQHELDGRFLFYLTLSHPFREVGASTMDGAGGQKRVPENFIRNYRPGMPPLTEQHAIAAFLDRETARIDALIAKKEELIRLLEEKRASLVTQVVTRGLSPDAPTVDSGIPAIGAVPAHWRVLRNKNILRAVQDPSPEGSEELLTVSHITGVTPRTEKDVTMFLAESNVGYPRVAPGDLVINTMWAWMGALGVARHHGIVSPAYGVYRFTDAEVLPEYYDAFYRTPAYVTEMTRFSTGVWSSRLRIYPDVFLSLRVVVPPIDEQRAILDHIKAATGDTDAVLDRLAASVALLREQRQALITAAVTGQIDISDELAEPAAPSTRPARPREDALA